MPQKYYSIPTEIGLAAITNASIMEQKVNITHLAVGDGKGNYYEPQSNAVSLKNETWRGNITNCEVDKLSPNIINITSVIPADIGGFTIREIGVFDEKSQLIAIANCPDTAKVSISDGISSELEVTMQIILMHTDAIKVEVNPTVILATKADIKKLKTELLEELKKHCEDSNIHIFKTEKQKWNKAAELSGENKEGIVNLNNKISDIEKKSLSDNTNIKSKLDSIPIYNASAEYKLGNSIPNLLGKSFKDKSMELKNVEILENGFAKFKPTEISGAFASGISANQIKLNKTYTFVVEIEKFELKTDFIINEPAGAAFKESIRLNSDTKKGIYKFNLTSKETINPDTLLIRFGNMGNCNGEVILRAMLLEGDWTNKDIPSLNYWEETFNTYELILDNPPITLPENYTVNFNAPDNVKKGDKVAIINPHKYLDNKYSKRLLNSEFTKSVDSITTSKDGYVNLKTSVGNRNAEIKSNIKAKDILKPNTDYTLILDIKDKRSDCWLYVNILSAIPPLYTKETYTSQSGIVKLKLTTRNEIDNADLFHFKHTAVNDKEQYNCEFKAWLVEGDYTNKDIRFNRNNDIYASDSVVNLMGKGLCDNSTIYPNDNIEFLNNGFVKFTSTPTDRFITIRSNFLAKDVLKPSTKYTLVAEVIDMQYKGSLFYITHQNKTIDPFVETISVDRVGISIHLLTTQEELTTQNMWQVQFNASFSGKSESCTARAMLLEGDWTNRDLPCEYWENTFGEYPILTYGEDRQQIEDNAFVKGQPVQLQVGTDGVYTAINKNKPGIAISNIPPENIQQLWLDTKDNIGLLKYYDGVNWQGVKTISILT